VNFAQIEYFLAVARAKKFCLAAEDSYVSQSSLSKQIKALEEELGVDLFVRSSAGVSLTPAGEAFLDFAGKTHRDYESTLLRLARYSAGAHLHMRVGALPLMAAYGLDSVLADFQIDNMSTQVDLLEREQTNLLRRLEMDQIEVAIIRTDSLSRDEYDWVTLVRDEIVIVCSNQHPLARAHCISTRDLKDERFVMLDPQSAINTTFCGECRREGFFPNVIFTHTRHEPLLAAVKRGIGISALPRGLTHVKDEASLCCVPLQTPLYTEVALVFRRDRELTPWADKLVRFFAEVYATPDGPAPAEDPPEES
jgi:LysR family transcriptional regulator, transcription activator of glutamate synthase operon